MKNIVLIGMPGVGKSTLGVILAKVLGYQFVDTDLIIQEEEKCLLSELIDKLGVDEFVKIENRIVSSIDVDKTVIATGGSVVYGKDAMNKLKELGVIIYIEQCFDTIQKRVENIHGRGVVLKHNQTFEDLYKERIALYKKYADITINQGDNDVESTLNSVIEKLKKQKNS